MRDNARGRGTLTNHTPTHLPRPPGRYQIIFRHVREEMRGRAEREGGLVHSIVCLPLKAHTLRTRSHTTHKRTKNYLHSCDINNGLFACPSIISSFFHLYHLPTPNLSWITVVIFCLIKVRRDKEAAGSVEAAARIRECIFQMFKTGF